MPMPKGTYDADTSLVYHFAERGTPPLDFFRLANRAQNPPGSRRTARSSALACANPS